MNAHRLRITSAAFSLIEVLLVLAIIAIVSAVGMPNLRELWQRLQAEHFMRQLSQHLAYARVHAIAQQHPVQICPRHGVVCSSDWNSAPIQLHQKALKNWQDLWLRELKHPVHSHQLFYSRPSLQFRQ